VLLADTRWLVRLQFVGSSCWWPPRFLLTMLSYGSGSAGGIFAPLLVIGALAGLAVGSAAHWIAPNLGRTSGSVRCSWHGCAAHLHGSSTLTGIVLMIELTGKYDYMLPLLVSCLWRMASPRP